MSERASLEPEWMDAPDADAASLERSLRYIRRINKMLGYNRATAKAIRRLAGDRPIRVLDVCCGSGDFAAWCDDYVGLDVHQRTLGLAKPSTLVRGNAMSLPIADGAFDVAVCQMALHHFETKAASALLAEMSRVTTIGWIAADLLRRRRASLWIGLFTLTAGPMVRHDARLSVRQAWAPDQAKTLGRQHGATYRETFGHRFLLTKKHGVV